MKYMDEYRDADLVRRLAAAIEATVTRSWTLMEICGGQTHSIVRFGLDELLPASIRLVHGPGCPVCVTPLEIIDRALAIAALPEVTFCSFGDMLRVPGSRDHLLALQARGADVRIVYSPLDAVQIARNHPDREVVFFAVGFETTAPANAMAVYQAAQAGLTNFSILVAHVLVPPALEAILSAPDNRVQGILAAGHVCVIVGTEEYHPIAERFKVPIVVTGFEPADILDGIYRCVRQLEDGRHEVENAYGRAVRTDGNPTAQDLIRTVFKIIPRKWRGIGELAASGLGLRDAYANFDAERRFALGTIVVDEPAACISGDVLRGAKEPSECPAFGSVCTPEHPIGAPMVSSEGACSAYYRYRPHSAKTSAA